jgi:IS5 family transposase
MLKSLRNLSDEEVVVFWRENPYAQDFCGEREMPWGLSCDASELTHFRKRAGLASAVPFLRRSRPYQKNSQPPELVISIRLDA